MRTKTVAAIIIQDKDGEIVTLPDGVSALHVSVADFNRFLTQKRREWFSKIRRISDNTPCGLIPDVADRVIPDVAIRADTVLKEPDGVNNDTGDVAYIFRHIENALDQGALIIVPQLASNELQYWFLAFIETPGIIEVFPLDFPTLFSSSLDGKFEAAYIPAFLHVTRPQAADEALWFGRNRNSVKARFLRRRDKKQEIFYPVYWPILAQLPTDFELRKRDVVNTLSRNYFITFGEFFNIRSDSTLFLNPKTEKFSQSIINAPSFTELIEAINQNHGFGQGGFRRIEIDNIKTIREMPVIFLLAYLLHPTDASRYFEELHRILSNHSVNEMVKLLEYLAAPLAYVLSYILSDALLCDSVTPAMNFFEILNNTIDGTEMDTDELLQYWKRNGFDIEKIDELTWKRGEQKTDLYLLRKVLNRWGAANVFHGREYWFHIPVFYEHKVRDIEYTITENVIDNILAARTSTPASRIKAGSQKLFRQTLSKFNPVPKPSNNNNKKAGEYGDGKSTVKVCYYDTLSFGYENYFSLRTCDSTALHPYYINPNFNSQETKRDS